MVGLPAAAALLWASLLCLTRPGTGITLDRNGFKGILVAINPSVPENPELIKKIKEMLIGGSTYLHEATERRVYFEEVTILVPATWKKGSYSRAKTEVYDQAHVLIAKANKVYGHNPYVLQYGPCGTPGTYMHLTPEYLLNDAFLQQFGPRDTLFVHEWAHLRWGVYDEYSLSQPFYLHNGVPEAVRCSHDIEGVSRKVSNPRFNCDIDPWTGLPTEDCDFYIRRQQTARTSIMYLSRIPSVNRFCNKDTHNIWAPNNHNRLCDQMSVEEVIAHRSVDSQVYLQLPPIEAPPTVSISVVQRQQRVVCLVLDISGSMSGERILNQRQAASLFIEKIVEEQSYVGIVIFSSSASVEKALTLIDGEAARTSLVDVLPTSATGGTEICLGLEKGLEELGRDGSTTGDEIIFLTDGQSNSPMDCLDQVKSSNTVVHTIALGNDADKQLVEMAKVSGGHFLLAAESVDSNALVDVFASLTTSSGDLSQSTIQLESTGSKTQQWFNGSVDVDRSVGKATSFLVLYQESPIDILVESPGKAKTYDTTAFSHDSIAKSYKLDIPDIATAGRWTYSLKNKQTSPQTLLVTVTSQAASDTVSPVQVRAHMSQLEGDGTKPLFVYATVHQGGVPVILAQVTATLVSEDGASSNIQLLDNGAGADAFKNDGVYSRYFIPKQEGRYSLKVKVKGGDSGSGSPGNKHSGALRIPGILEDDGVIVVTPPMPEVSDNDIDDDVGNFSRTAIGASFTVNIDPSKPRPVFPPNKVTDLSAQLVNGSVLLIWTAPGEDMDVGTAKEYDLRFSQDPNQLRENFTQSKVLNTSALQPQESGSTEQHSFPMVLPNNTVVFFAMVAIDAENAISEISNLAQVTLFVAPSGATSVFSHSFGLVATVVMAALLAFNAAMF